MSIFEYLATIVAIVLGLATANLLNKFSRVIVNINWKSLGWFFSLWCLLLLICLLGYFWSFWRLYSGVEEFSIWEFILVPFVSVVCFFLISVFLPVPEDSQKSVDPSEYFLEFRKPFYVTLTILWLHFGIMPFVIEFQQNSFEIAFGWLMVIISFSGVFIRTIRSHKFLVLAFSISFLSQEAIQLGISSM